MKLSTASKAMLKAVEKHKERQKLLSERPDHLIPGDIISLDIPDINEDIRWLITSETDISWYLTPVDSISPFIGTNPA